MSYRVLALEDAGPARISTVMGESSHRSLEKARATARIFAIQFGDAVVLDASGEELENWRMPVNGPLHLVVA